MRKKFVKKIMTVLIAVALVFTNSGVASLATENTPVKFIYPNVTRLTMITETEAKLNVDVIPRDASNQKVTFSSSNEGVATVSSSGLVTAVASGKAIITVKAADGSGAKETVNVTVLKNLVIDGSFVDPDNDVIVIDRTYGHVTVDGSVGDADVYLAGLKIRGDLILEAGKYNVETYDTSINNVIFSAPLVEDTEIESFSLSEDEEVDQVYPRLNVGRDSQISNVNISASGLISQAKDTQIDKITFTQDDDGKITLYLDGYSGDLLLDSYLGDIEIVVSNSTLGQVTIDGPEASGNVKMTDLDGTSSIDALTLSGAAKVEVQLPTKEISIDRKADGASLVVGGATGTLNNAGNNSDIKVNGSVDALETIGESAKINVGKGALVLSINIDGKGSSLSGAGQVAEAYVNANDVSIDTANTLVVIGDVVGAKVYGVEQASGSTATSQPPVIYVPGPPVPEVEYKVGQVLYENDFETMGTRGISSVQGDVNIRLVDGGNDSDKAALVSGKTAEWNGAGIYLSEYTGKYLTLRIKADIKGTVDGDLKATLKTNGDSYTGIDSVAAEAGRWYTLDGTIVLDGKVKSADMYFESPGTSNYYLDNVEITVDSIGDAIPATGVSLDKNEITVDIGGKGSLMATVKPEDADNKTVTWKSSNEAVATVNNGVVTGVSTGEAVITVTTVDGSFKATANVTVTDNVALKLDHHAVVFQNLDEMVRVKANVADGITWSSSDDSVATVEDGLVTAKGFGNAVISVALGENLVTCDVVVNDDIIFYEDFEDSVSSLKVEESWSVESQEIVTDENGYKSLKVTNRDEWNSVHVPIKNNGSTEASYVVTSYISGVNGEVEVQYFDPVVHGIGDPVTAPMGVWTKLQSPVIVVGAGKSMLIRFRTPIGEEAFLLDTVYITQVSGEPGEEPVDPDPVDPVDPDPVDPVEPVDPTDPGEDKKLFFDNFYLGSEPIEFSLTESTNSWDDPNMSSDAPFYLNGDNLKEKASASGIVDATLLDKFTSWEGVRELVKGFEFEVTVTGGTSMADATNLIADFIVQNETAPGKYDGSFKTVRYDLGLEEVSSDSPITFTKQFLFDDYDWNPTDASMVKAALRFLNIDSETTVTGSLNVKVLSNDSTVVPEEPDNPDPVEPEGPYVIELFTADFEDLNNPFMKGTWDSFTDYEAVHNEGTITVVTGSAIGFNGSNAYLEIKTVEDWEGVGFHFANIETATYRIEARVKNAEAVTGTAIRLQNQTAGEYINDSKVVFEDDRWHLLDVTFTLDAVEGGTNVMLSPHYEDPAFHFYIDDFKVYKIEK